MAGTGQGGAPDAVEEVSRERIREIEAKEE